MDNLNELELAVPQRLSFKYPSLKNHIPHQKVLNREITGVGCMLILVVQDPLRILK